MSQKATIECLGEEAFRPRKDLLYLDTGKMFALYEKIAFKGNHILVGPKGIAKSRQNKQPHHHF